MSIERLSALKDALFIAEGTKHSCEMLLEKRIGNKMYAEYGREWSAHIAARIQKLIEETEVSWCRAVITADVNGSSGE